MIHRAPPAPGRASVMRADASTMTAGEDPFIESAEVVLPCKELASTLAFFVERLRFRLDAIFPADDPRVAQLSGHGLRLRLERDGVSAPGVLRLACRNLEALSGGRTELLAPNGTRLQLVPAEPQLTLPPLNVSFVLSRLRDSSFVEGRAGMRYRDLIPDRLGGRFIASHIVIAAGGPVPDYVHFHAVAFQMIFCAKGWVRVVYEDQGEPFVLRAGDCALQPPRIRHRVLECSPGLEVIEVSSPAEHETFVEHALTLPAGAIRPDRQLGGQRFVRHDAGRGRWEPWRSPGFEARDLGIGAATSGIASARVIRARRGGGGDTYRHPGELLFAYVLQGATALDRPGLAAPPEPLTAGDAFCVPASQGLALTGCSSDFEMLEVRLPAS